MKYVICSLLLLASSTGIAKQISAKVSVGNIEVGSQFIFRNHVNAQSGVFWKNSKYCSFELGTKFQDSFSFLPGQVVTISEVVETRIQTALGAYVENIFIFSGSKKQAIFSDETRVSANVTIDLPYSVSSSPLDSPDFVGMTCVTKSNDLITIEDLASQGARLGFELNLK